MSSLRLVSENIPPADSTPANNRGRVTPRKLVDSAKKLLSFGPAEPEEHHWISRPKNVERVAYLTAEGLEWHGDNFTLNEEIGKGSFATVYRATHKATGATFAIKKVQLHCGANVAQIRRQKESLEREINVLKTCRSPYIVSYFGSYTDQNDGAIFIVMEFLAGGTLHDVIKHFKEDGGLTEESSHGVLRNVLLGLDYLHQQGFVHRDLKTKNILIDNDGSTRLADFGVSRELLQREYARSMVGTPLFMAPEVMAGHAYTSKADVWSYGICVLEVVNGAIPYHGMPVRELFRVVLEKEPPTVLRPDEWSKELASFVKCILQKDPQARPSTAELLKTDWILGIQQDDEVTKTTMKMRTLGRASSFHQAAFRDTPTKKVVVTPPVKRKPIPSMAVTDAETEATYADKPKEEVVSELLKWKAMAIKLMNEQETREK